ncbi:hypothetical protein [Mesorhizobium sp. B2-8-9]|uniref:hypothetical protein n=1 Tax=Mesorhizobium sp. B2-8-9 TaxID=2589899 RepID=UPI001AEDD658|nr:hypothetical protein [Mesorhizobium sp. B2-8-9]
MNIFGGDTRAQPRQQAAGGCRARLLQRDAAAFARKNRFTQTPPPQMFVDSTKDPITVTVSEICFVGAIPGKVSNGFPPGIASRKKSKSKGGGPQ